MTLLSLDAPFRRGNFTVMAKPRTVGNMIAPWRFLVFLGLLIGGAILAWLKLQDPPLGIMAAFDVAAITFILLCLWLLEIRDPLRIERIAEENDGNRTLLLVITVIVMAVLLLSIAAETVGQRPEPFTKVLIILTLIVAWVFSNTVYALHYAHLVYIVPGTRCDGLDFPNTKLPIYWDFVYFAFTLGMTFQTSDVTITNERIRRVVTVHCFAAFFFNIGVLAFTINVLGSA
jgi:uncharacterized membrane protein